MTAESLQQIIAVESELHAREQEEQTGAELWLREQEAALRTEYRQRRDALTAEMEASLQQARADAERRATEIVNSAEGSGRQFSGVSDEVLRRVLARHLVAILTGRLP